MSERNLTLLTDLYELTMMQGYFHAKDANETVIFDAFYRTNPDGNGFAITAGLEQVVEYIENLHFDKEDIDYLRTTGLFGEDFLEYLSTFKFTGDIYAIPEGTVVFPREPLVKVIAPIMQAQLVETAILNIINHQSLIATKTSRIVHAARGDGVMEFGLRRAQGPDAGIYGARAAMIAGCIGTSNVLCGQMFDVPVKGTHAHSWIMSFPDELTAFRTYARLYPTACILLVDTYDTLNSGIPHAIQVFKEMRAEGIPLTFYGIRMDSGDLAYLSKEAKKMLDAEGFTDAVISASNDLDETLITSLKNQGATINSWGVGTNLITSKDCPSSAVFISSRRSWTRRLEPSSRRSSSPRTRRRSQTRATRPPTVSTERTATRSSRTLSVSWERPSTRTNRYCSSTRWQLGKRPSSLPELIRCVSFRCRYSRTASVSTTPRRSWISRNTARKSSIPYGMRQNVS